GSFLSRNKKSNRLRGKNQGRVRLTRRVATLSTDFLHHWLSLVKCGSFDSPTPIPFWCDLDIFRRPEMTFSLDNLGGPMHFDSSRLWSICTRQIIHNNCSTPSGFRVGVLQRALEIHAANQKAATFEGEPHWSHIGLTVRRDGCDACKPLGLQISDFLFRKHSFDYRRFSMRYQMSVQTRGIAVIRQLTPIDALRTHDRSETRERRHR